MDLDQVTRDTLEMVKKAQSEGILVSTGIYGYDLAGLVSTVPVNVPARNNTSAFPRTIASEGAPTAVWRALLNVNSQQTDAAVGMDYAGALALISEMDVFAPYKPLAKAGRVTVDAEALARSYADALATDTLQTLIQLFLGEDMHIINSQGWSLGTKAELGKPKLVMSETGGSIKKGEKVEVKMVARSGANYFTGTESAPGVIHAGGTEASEAEVVETKVKETCSVVASHKAVKGAAAYDWYVGKESGELFYYTTTTIASVLIKTIPTEAEALPNLPLLSAALPLGTAKLVGERVVKDTSYDEKKWFNGVVASTLGDYGAAGPVTPGKGTSSGASFIDNGGNAITSSGADIGILDEMNEKLWESVQLSPTAYMCNSKQAAEISSLILGSTAAVTLLPATDADARTNLAGGGYVERYINKAAGGVPVAIEVHPRVAPGTIIARTDRVPFPGSNIGSVFEFRCQYDCRQYDYAANYNPGVVGGGPRKDYEIRTMATLVNRAPVAQCVAANIA